MKVDYSTFIPPIMFNNSGNMGLPLALLAFGEAMVPAVLNYIIAEQYRQEPEKAASIVMLANVDSLVITPLALALALC